jgi:quinone-modifying oxidoreductase subunit QmoC
MAVGERIGKRVGPQRRRAILSRSEETKFSVPRPAIDFGWRLRGSTIRLLRDSSLTLFPVRQRATAALLTQYCPDGNSLLSCLQCGACTVSCHLAETDGALFPRRQMTFLQLGEVDRLLADPSVWLCFNCQDCTSRCPANAGPGRIMAAIRRLAVEHYSLPRWWSRLVNQRRGFLSMLLVAIALLLAAIAVGGSFSPQITPVRYAGMLPHFTLNLFFAAIAGMVMIGTLIGAARAWKAFTGESLREADLGRLVHSFVSVTRQIATHRQFSQCQQFPLSRWAHISVFYGFITLLALAGAAATLIALGAPYPLPVFHPFKIAGNLAAVLVISGSFYFCIQRRRASRNRDASSWFDWVLLVELLLVSVTGLLSEIFRYANVGVLAYPTYFLHLVFVLVLLAGSANSKFAHVFYRTVALTAEEYKALSEVPLADLEPGRVAA